MKTGQKIARSVKCPHYHKHEKLRLFCDSFCSGGLSTITPFEREEDRALHMQRYCKSRRGYLECPLVGMIGGIDDDP